MRYWVRSKIGIITLIVGVLLVIVLGFLTYKFILNSDNKPELTIDNAITGQDYLMELAISAKIESGLELTDEERDFYSELLKKRKEEAGGWVEVDKGYEREELVFKGEKESADYDGVTVTLTGIKTKYEKGEFKYIEVLYDITNNKSDEIRVYYKNLKMDNVRFENSGTEVFVLPNKTESFGILLVVNNELDETHFKYNEVTGTLIVEEGDFEFGIGEVKNTTENVITHYRK